MDVYNYAIEIAKAEGISRNDLGLLKVAVLMHDAGFTQGYTGHEQISQQMAKTLLPQFEYLSDEIEKVCGMIEATCIPQRPHNLLEEIIADADLLYLGTDRFTDIGETLFEEMKVYTGLKSREEWNQIQIRFLKQHHYHTAYCHQHYEPAKQRNLELLIQQMVS